MRKKQPAFKIEIEDPQQIYNLIISNSMDALDVCIGNCPLNRPAIGLNITLDSDSKNYSLEAEIVASTKKTTRKKAKSKPVYHELKIPFAQIKQKFSAKKIGQSAIILDQHKREIIMISPMSDPNSLLVEFGGESTVSQKVSSLEKFAYQLEYFVSVVEFLVNNLYPPNSRLIPAITCYLKPSISTSFYTESDSFTDTTTTTTTTKKSLNLEVENPRISFAQIGGNKTAKDEIMQLATALNNRSQYEFWGTRPPKGVLLTGLPGTGKSLLAKALATFSGSKFLAVGLASLLSKWYGETEQLTAQAFKMAADNAPCTLYLDEIDAFAGDRNNSHEASVGMLSVILTHMDGLNANDRVLVLGATNRLEAVDPALRRSGRFDRIIEVPLPDDQAREEILKIKMNDAKTIAQRELFGDMDWSLLIQRTQGTTGADLTEIIRRTLEFRMRQGSQSGMPSLISTDEILWQIRNFEHIKKSAGKIIHGFNDQPL